jgi:glycosyltransferase involved in cell wall biosynthesis
VSKSKQKLISIVLPTLGGGGAERVNIELAREFLRMGYAVEFVVMQGGGELIGIVPEGATVTDLGVPRFRYTVGRLRRYFASRRPDAALVSMWPLTGAALAAWKLAKVSGRIVVAEHVDFRGAPQLERLSRAFMRTVGRPLYRLADAIVCVSQGARAALAAEARIPTELITVIYNPVRPPSDPLPIDDAALRDWWFGADVRLIAIGRLIAQKDHATLIRSFDRVRQRLDARLLILGEGPQRGMLERLVNELGLGDGIRLPGFKHNVASYLDAASVLVLSSRWEGLGNVLIEALQHGVPVVSTDCPSGPAEVLEGGRLGTLVAVGDADALADAIAAAVHAPVNKDALRRAGQRYEPRAIAEAYVALLDPDRAGTA